MSEPRERETGWTGAGCPKCGVELPHTHSEKSLCDRWYPDLTDEFVASIASKAGTIPRYMAHNEPARTLHYMRLLATEVLRLRRSPQGGRKERE